MKFLSTLIFSLSFAAVIPLSWGVQEKQLTKGIKFQYTDLSEKGDNDVFEMNVYDPRLYFMNPRSSSPELLVDIEHEGVWKSNIHMKDGDAELESSGKTHFIINDKISMTLNNRPFEGSIAGNNKISIIGDLSKIKGAIAQFQGKEGKNEIRASILDILESLKEVAFHGEGRVIIQNSIFGSHEFVYTPANIHYRHTSGAMPEEITSDGKFVEDFTAYNLKQYVDLSKLGKMDFSWTNKTSLSPWKEVVGFLSDISFKNLPEINFESNGEGKSQLFTKTGKIAFKNQRGEEPSMNYSMQGSWKFAQDWVKQFTSGIKFLDFTANRSNGSATKIALQDTMKATSPNDVIKVTSPIDTTEMTSPSDATETTSPEINGVAPKKKNDYGLDDQQMRMAMAFFSNWVSSKETTSFLSLLPLQVDLDVNGGMDYAQAPFAAKKTTFLASMLGNSKHGVKIDFNDQKKGEWKLEVVLAGGRAFFDELFQAYDALNASLREAYSRSYYQDAPWNQLSPQFKENLYKLLLSYVDDSKNEQKELKFTIKSDQKGGLTVGGKSLYRLQSDINTFIQQESKDMYE